MLHSISNYTRNFIVNLQGITYEEFLEFSEREFNNFYQNQEEALYDNLITLLCFIFIFGNRIFSFSYSELVGWIFLMLLISPFLLPVLESNLIQYLFIKAIVVILLNYLLQLAIIKPDSFNPSHPICLGNAKYDK